MAPIDLNLSRFEKTRQYQQWKRSEGLEEIRQELKMFGLHETSLGIQEVFKSAPHQVLRPVQLVDWCKQFVKEAAKSKLPYHRIVTIVRTKGVQNYYSSQQLEASLEHAVKELRKEGIKIKQY
jgi:hypothetical protein